MLNPGVPRGGVSFFVVAVFATASLFFGISATQAWAGGAVSAERPVKERPVKERPGKGEDPVTGEDPKQAKQELKCARAEEALKQAKKAKRKAKKAKRKAKGKKAKKKAKRRFKAAKGGLATAKIRVDGTCSSIG